MLDLNENRAERIKELIETVNIEELINTFNQKLIIKNDSDIYLGYNVVDDKLDLYTQNDCYFGHMYAAILLPSVNFEFNDDYYDLRNRIKVILESNLNFDNFIENISIANSFVIEDDDEYSISNDYYKLKKAVIKGIVPGIDVFNKIQDKQELFDSFLTKNSYYCQYGKTPKLIISKNDLCYNDFIKTPKYIKYVNTKKLFLDLDYVKIFNFFDESSNVNLSDSMISSLEKIFIKKEFNYLVDGLRNKLYSLSKIYPKLVDETDEDTFEFKQRFMELNRIKKLIQILELVEFY